LAYLLDAGTKFRDLADVTWSEDNATGYGVAYVRADLADGTESEDAGPAAMWDRFVAKLNADQPLGTVKKPLPHKSMLGSIEKYRAVFMAANADAIRAARQKGGEKA